MSETIEKLREAALTGFLGELDQKIDELEAEIEHPAEMRIWCPKCGEISFVAGGKLAIACDCLAALIQE